MMYKVVGIILALCAIAFSVPATYDTEHVWKAGNLSYTFPTNAVLGGFDPNGYKIYVGRVKYSYSILPARVVAETGTAYFNTDTTASRALLYELLVAERNLEYVWIRSYDGFYETDSVSTGTAITNERVFICRATTDGGLLFGTLLLTKKVCIIKHETLPLREFDRYEVLVAQPKSCIKNL